MSASPGQPMGFRAVAIRVWDDSRSAQPQRPRLQLQELDQRLPVGLQHVDAHVVLAAAAGAGAPGRLPRRPIAARFAQPARAVDPCCALLLAIGSGKTLGKVDFKSRKSDVLYLKGLIEAGKLVSAIDRRFSLEQVPAAIAYLEEGHARGKVVITV